MKRFTRLWLVAAAVFAAANMTTTAYAPAAVADTVATTPGASTSAVSPQLVGGIPATMHPSWIVSVHRDAPIGSGNSVNECGGELISPRWVLTAAHCVTDATGLGIDPTGAHLWVQVGTNDSTKGAKGGQIFTVTQVVPYSQWDWGQTDSQGRSGDIVGLELTGYDITDQPVDIASADPKIGTKVRQLGWGRTSPDNTGPEPTRLQQVDTTFAGSGAAAAPCNTNPDNPITVDENCANAADGWRGGCGGDSGGPLLAKFNGRWELVGILSQSPGLVRGCGGEADIYTSITYYQGWLAGIERDQDPQTAEDYLPGGPAAPITHTAPTASYAASTRRGYELAG